MEAIKDGFCEKHQRDTYAYTFTISLGFVRTFTMSHYCMECKAWCDPAEQSAYSISTPDVDAPDIGPELEGRMS